MATILLIESNPNHRLLFAEQLTDYGHTVHAAASAAEALQQADSRATDLVLLSAAPLDHAAGRLVRCLRQQCHHLPLILVCNSDPGDDTRAHLAPDACWVKRSDPAELFSAIDAALTRPTQRQPGRGRTLPAPTWRSDERRHP